MPSPSVPPHKRPFAPVSLDHVVLRVQDIDAMLGFYRDVLGCEIARHNVPLGLWHLRLGPTMIDLVELAGPLVDGGGTQPGREGLNMDHLCIRVSPFDADALRAYLKACGVESEPASERFGAEGDGLSIYLSDPQGNRVELRGTLKP